MPLLAAEIEETMQEGYAPVRMETDRGAIEAHYYPVPDGKLAVVWIGGAGGGFDTPARGLYTRLSGSCRRPAPLRSTAWRGRRRSWC